MQAIPGIDRRMRASRTKIWHFAGALMLGAMLAGCDKCGDWWYPARGEAQVETQACRDQAPRPQ